MEHRKRKIAVLATVFSLALFTFVYGMAFPSGALAWDNCPQGPRERSVSGRLPALRRHQQRRHLRPVPVEPRQIRRPPPRPLAVTTTTGEPPTGDCPLGPCAGCGACLSVRRHRHGRPTPATASASAGPGRRQRRGARRRRHPDDHVHHDPAPAVAAASRPSKRPRPPWPSPDVAVDRTPDGGFLTHYLVSPIALGFILIYGASFLLYKTKRIRHGHAPQDLEPACCSATFLITGIFGTMLAIQLDYTLPFSIPVDLLFWHVEAGIAMTLHLPLPHGLALQVLQERCWRTPARRCAAIRTAEREFDLDDRRLVLEAREARRAERAGSAGRQARPASAATHRSRAGADSVRACSLPSARPLRGHRLHPGLGEDPGARALGNADVRRPIRRRRSARP